MSFGISTVSLRNPKLVQVPTLRTLSSIGITLLSCPHDRAYDASAVRDYLLSTLTPDAAKRCLTQIKACCNWAMEEGAIETNPFALMKIKLPKGLSEEQDINPFSKEERDLIIQTFEARSLLFSLHQLCTLPFLYRVQTF